MILNATIDVYYAVVWPEQQLGIQSMNIGKSTLGAPGVEGK